MTALSRRSLLKRLALVVLAGALPAGLRAQNADRRWRPPSARLTRCLSDPQSAAVLGARYLARMPEEADRELLARLIAGARRRALRLARADTRRLRALLARQQRADFACGRTVCLDGWVLSRTEARLCALAALERAAI